MKLHLKELLDLLPTNPKLITRLEDEVERITREEPISFLLEAFKIEDSNLRFYLLLILEKKMHLLKESRLPLSEIISASEVVLVNYEFKSFDQKKLAKIHAKLGLYEWPNNYSNFFNIFSNLMANKRKIGYLILENFLYFMHNSLDIEENRRNELKRAIIIYKEPITQLINNEFCIEEVVLIFTHLISILPRPINFDIIYEKGILCLERTLDFFLEAISAKYCDSSFFLNLVKFSDLIDVEPKMIECFLHLKEQIYNKNLQLYSYVFKGLDKNIFTFSLSLQFWNFLFRKNMEDEIYVSLALEVMQEVIRVVVTKKDDECNSIKMEDLESDIVSLFSLISQNYQNANHIFLTKFVNNLPRKYAVILLKANKNKSLLPLSCVYLKGLALYLDNDPLCVEMLPQLDLNDKDSCKLVAQIVRKFCIDKYKLITLLNSLQNFPFTEEAIANVILKLEDPNLIKQVLEGEMNLKKAHILFYFLKYKPEIVSNDLHKFYIFFLNERPFDRAFSIISFIYQNFPVPKEIWEKIYSSLDFYSLRDLNYFCTDLLQRLNEEIQIPFVEKVFFRLNTEWKSVDDEIELSLTTKAFLTVIESLVLKNLGQQNEIQYTNLLIDFLKETDPTILLKVYAFYNRVKFAYDTERMVLNLLMCYNSYEMVDCQNEIISMLIDCIKKEDGPCTFQKFNFDINEANRISGLVKNSSTKRSRALFKDLLADIKGKPLSTLYQPSNKIQSQNLFGGSAKKNGEDDSVVFGNLFQ